MTFVSDSDKRFVNLRFAAFKFEEICLTRQLARWPITTYLLTFELARSILIERFGSNINSSEHSSKLYTVQKKHTNI